MAESVGSIRAEATLDIDKFKAAASQLGTEGAKIAKSLDKAGAGLDKAKLSLDNLNNGLAVAQAQLASANAAFSASAKSLDEMQISAEEAALKVVQLEKAYERAKASFGETSLQAYQAQKEYQTAAAAADELAIAVEQQQQKANKNSVALEKAAASVKKYENGIKSAKSQISGFENQISGLSSIIQAMAGTNSAAARKTLETFGRTTLSSAGESLGTFAVRAAGGDTTSLLGILSSRGISRGVIALAKGLSATSLGMVAVGGAAAYAGYKIYQAAQDGADGVKLWEQAYEGVDQERTTKFTQIVEAGIELADTGLTEQVNSVYDQIGKALTDGKPDTAAVISEISGSAQGMFTEVRNSIQQWYDLEMAKLDLSTPAGIQKAEELTLEYNGLINSVNELDANTAGFIASYAGKSTAECEAALTQLDTYETELERLAGRAAELTSILQSNQAAAFTTVTSGITTDTTTVANATAYVQFEYSTKLRYAEEDHETEMAALWQQYQTDLQTATTEQGRMLVEADYEIKLRQATESYAATKSQLSQEYTQMLSEVMQGVAEAASRSNPELAAAIQTAISGDFSKLKDLKLDDPALSAAMKGFVETGVLDGITNADLSTAEGQLEAMIRLLAQGTAEYAQGAFEKLGVRNTEGLAGIVGAVFGSGAATEVEDPVQRISELADQTSAALQKLSDTGSEADLKNVQELFRTSFDYDDGDVSGMERLATFMDAVNAAAASGNLDAEALQKYGAVMNDIMLVLNSMQQAGGAENLSFLVELSTALNSLGYSTDYSTVVSALNEIWAAWQPFANAETSETVTLTPEIQVNEQGVPMPTVEQLRQMGYFDFEEPVQIQVPAEVEPWPILEAPVDTPKQAGESATAAIENYGTAATNSVGSVEQIAAAINKVNEAVIGGGEITPELQAQAQALLDYIMAADAAGVGTDLMAGIAVEMQKYGWNVPAAAIALAIITALRTACQTHSPSTLTMPVGTDLTAGVAEGMKDTSAITAAATMISASAVAGLRGNLAASGMIGLNFSRGLAAGIRSGRSGVVSAAASVARAAAAAAKSELDIHSPSGVTFDYGEFFDLGLIKGIEHLQPDIDDAVREALYLEPPSGVAYAVQNRVSASPNASVSIDYERLAQAMSQYHMSMYINDKKMADVLANSNAQAQNSRSRSIALGYGISRR